MSDPAGQLARIAAFLDLDRGWNHPGTLMRERVNASDIPRFQAAFAYARRFGALLTRHDLDWIVRYAKRAGVPKLFGRRGASPPLAEPMRRMFEEYYRDEITILEGLLDLDLQTWWDNVGSGVLPR